MKVYCSVCKEFIYHKRVVGKGFKLFCTQCLARGSVWKRWLIVLSPMVLFLLMVYTLWKGR